MALYLFEVDGGSADYCEVGFRRKSLFSQCWKVDGVSRESVNRNGRVNKAHRGVVRVQAQGRFQLRLLCRLLHAVLNRRRRQLRRRRRQRGGDRHHLHRTALRLLVRRPLRLFIWRLYNWIMVVTENEWLAMRSIHVYSSSYQMGTQRFYWKCYNEAPFGGVSCKFQLIFKVTAEVIEWPTKRSGWSPQDDKSFSTYPI